MTESHQERLQKIKSQFPNAYEPWSAENDELLRTSSKKGMSIEALAKILQRQPGAIRSRLHKLGINIVNGFQQDDQDPPPLTAINNPIIDPEPATSDLILKSIGPLTEADPMVRSLLITKIRTDFFEKPQQKNAINALADQIIDVISQLGDENAD
jgi:hypothetical protein